MKKLLFVPMLTLIAACGSDNNKAENAEVSYPRDMTYDTICTTTEITTPKPGVTLNSSNASQYGQQVRSYRTVTFSHEINDSYEIFRDIDFASREDGTAIDAPYFSAGNVSYSVLNDTDTEISTYSWPTDSSFSPNGTVQNQKITYRKNADGSRTRIAGEVDGVSRFTPATKRSRRLSSNVTEYTFEYTDLGRYSNSTTIYAYKSMRCIETATPGTTLPASAVAIPSPTPNESANVSIAPDTLGTGTAITP